MEVEEQALRVVSELQIDNEEYPDMAWSTDIQGMDEDYFRCSGVKYELQMRDLLVWERSRTVHKDGEVQRDTNEREMQGQGTVGTFLPWPFLAGGYSAKSIETSKM